MEQPRMSFRFQLIISIAFLLASCSSFDLIPSDSLIQRLKGRGPVLVSPDNDYLAANLLLKQESARSQELAGFLNTKGQPSALSVSQDFLQPARISLFYKDSSEQYDLELLQGIWVINGPSKIHDQAAQELLASSLQQDSALSLDSENKYNSSDFSNQNLIPLFEDNQNLEQAQPLEPVVKRTQKKIPQRSTSAGNESTSKIEALISSYASSPAETTPRGDIVHFVTSEQESLSIVAKWYTKSALTLSRIARANKLAPSAVLRPGDQIVIPAELVKNKMRLPEEAIAELGGS